MGTDAACDTSIFVCGDSDASINGWAGQQASRLTAAMDRNNYKNAECPTSTCTGLSGWWQDLLVDNNPTVTAVMSNNVCVEDNVLYYIETDATYNTCVAFSE